MVNNTNPMAKYFLESMAEIPTMSENNTAKVLPVPYTTNACVHFGPHNQPVKIKCIACMQANLVNCAINN